MVIKSASSRITTLIPFQEAALANPFTNSGTGVIPNLFNVPAAMVEASVVAASSHTIKIVDSAGTAYYLMASTTAP